MARVGLMAVAAAFCVSVLPASAQGFTNHYEFKIGRQPLDSALRTFARQTGLQVARLEPDSTDHAHVLVGPLQGNLSATQALGFLLAPTGLAYAKINDRTLAVVRSSAESGGSPTGPLAGIAGSAPGVSQGSGESTRDPPAEGSLQEIVVTATKRRELALDIPASISAISTDYIQRMHVTKLDDLEAVAPGLVVNNYGPGNVTIVFRGLDGQSNGALVATVIDDAIVGAGLDELQVDMFPDDVARIEVLRGPQGTLYGANAMGGVLRYVTVSPDLHKTQGSAGGESFLYAGAEKPGYSAHAALSAPVIPGKFALRFSFYDRETPGNYYNPILGSRYENSASNRGARLAMLWQPASTLSVKLQGIYQQTQSANNSGARGTLLGAAPPFEIGAPLDPPLTLPHRVQQPWKSVLELATATIDWDLGFADLVSATSYSRTYFSSQIDNTASYLGLAQQFDATIPNTGAVAEPSHLALKEYSEEVRLASKSEGRLDWIAGLYATHDLDRTTDMEMVYDGALRPVADVNPFVNNIAPNVYDEMAAFANVTYHVTPALALNAGVRESKVRQELRSIANGVLDLAANGGLVAVQHFDTSADVFNYEVSPSYHFTRRAMAYFRLATGYRPGTAQGSSLLYPQIPAQVAPDRTTNYEVGFKEAFPNQRIQFAVDTYWIDWGGTQISLVTPDGAQLYTENGGRAVSKGVESSIRFMPVRKLTLDASAAYNSAYFTRVDPAAGFAPGARLSSAPKWTGSLSGEFAFNPIGQWRPSVSATARYTDSKYTAPSTSSEAILIPGHAVFDAEADFDNGNVNVSVYAHNIANKNYYATAVLMNDSVTGANYVLGQAMGEQRMIGVSMDWKF